MSSAAWNSTAAGARCCTAMVPVYIWQAARCHQTVMDSTRSIADSPREQPVCLYWDNTDTNVCVHVPVVLYCRIAKVAAQTRVTTRADNDSRTRQDQLTHAAPSTISSSIEIHIHMYIYNIHYTDLHPNPLFPPSLRAWLCGVIDIATHCLLWIMNRDRQPNPLGALRWRSTKLASQLGLKCPAGSTAQATKFRSGH